MVDVAVTAAIRARREVMAGDASVEEKIRESGVRYVVLMSPVRPVAFSLLLVVGSALSACSDESRSDSEVAAEFTSAFIDGDVDELAALSTGLEDLGQIPWRAQFLAALDLEADSAECVENGTQFTCTIVGHNARTKLLAPDFEVKRRLRLTIDDGVVSRGSFEFASPDMQPIFDAFNQWAFDNRRDVIDGPCADLDGTSDPAECAAAVLEVAHQYLADSDE